MWFVVADDDHGDDDVVIVLLLLLAMLVPLSLTAVVAGVVVNPIIISMHTYHCYCYVLRSFCQSTYKRVTKQTGLPSGWKLLECKIFLVVSPPMMVNGGSITMNDNPQCTINNACFFSKNGLLVYCCESHITNHVPPCLTSDSSPHIIYSWHMR